MRELNYEGTTTMSSAIETRGLSRRFGDRLAVDRIDMHVPERSIYGFLGRNGAGKTTTIRLLLGLLRPDAGQARIAGIDVSRNRMAAARKVGALLEAQGFHPHLDGRENLDLSRRLLGLPATEVERVLEVVEMTPHARRRVGDYSLGMRQRLGLARAMLGAPPVLVLDEPTNGLDPEGIADMRRLSSRRSSSSSGSTVSGEHKTSARLHSLSESSAGYSSDTEVLRGDCFCLVAVLMAVITCRSMQMRAKERKLISFSER